MMPICKFHGTLTKGVASISFTPSGDKLAAIGIDPNHSIAIFDTTTKSTHGGTMLLHDHCGQENIFDLKWKNDNEFVTVGIKHFKVWTSSNTGLKNRRGVWGKEKCSNKLLTVGLMNDEYIAGAIDGTL